MSLPAGPTGCCFCGVSFNPRVHTTAFVAASPQQLAAAEAYRGFKSNASVLCPTHAHEQQPQRASSVASGKRKKKADDSREDSAEDDCSWKRQALDIHSVASTAAAAASVPPHLAPQSAASSVSASSRSSEAVELTPELYSALCRAAHIPLDPPLDAALVPKLLARCIDDRVSLRSPGDYTARILQAMRDDEVLLFRDHPNFTKKESVPVTRTDTPLLAFRSNMAENSMHMMARLSTLTKKDLERCTNLPFQRTYNLLCDLPLTCPLAGNALWWAQSVADGAPLHADFVDTELSGMSGRKAWVTVKYQEARDAGLDIVDVRNAAPSYSWAQFLQCPSFRWFIVAKGDTLFMPANRLHGTHALGATLATGCGHYLAHLPSLPHILRYWTEPSLRPPVAQIKQLVDCWLLHLKGADSAMRQAIQQARTASNCDSCSFSSGSPLMKLQRALQQLI